jgi:hypothetical protein
MSACAGGGQSIDPNIEPIVAHLALASVEMTCPGTLALGDYFLEETQHAMLGDMDRLDDAGGLNDRDAN